MLKSSDLSPSGPRIIITSAPHQSAAERATFEMTEAKLGEYSGYRGGFGIAHRGCGAGACLENQTRAGLWGRVQFSLLVSFPFLLLEGD